MASSHSLTRQKLIEIAGTLPPAPRVFAELHGLLRNVNTDIDRITELIKKDPSLAAQVLRVSNSVVFRSEQRAGSVEDAVGRIGFQEVYRIVGLVAAHRLSERALVHYDVSAERLREHMVETAFVCEALASECRLDARTAYTAGLMRPIGILVLDRVADLLKIEPPYDHEHDGSYLSWEGRNFGMGSCEVAGLILSDWAFPNEIVGAIRDQYLNFENATQNRMACLMNIACGVVASDGRAMEGETKYWEVTDEKLQALGLNRSVFTQVSKRALKAYGAYRGGVAAAEERESAAALPPAMLAPMAEEARPEPAPVPLAVEVTEQIPSPADTLVTAPRESWWSRSFARWPLHSRLLFLVTSGAATGGMVVLLLQIGLELLAGPAPARALTNLRAIEGMWIRLADLVQAVSVAAVDLRVLVLCATVGLLYLGAVRLASHDRRDAAGTR